MNEAPPQGRPASAEHARLAQSSSDHPSDWKAIGPYLSERAWGTVREDYSPDGNAWNYFPYEHARSRAYRWSEDGLAGICDLNQYLCFAMAFWNGRDPFLKERLFGLSGWEGNHGEDVKEYWWYADATPTASWLSWRYHYPQSEFPYARLREENARRGRQDREFELIDAGAFDDDRYWQIVVDYAKAAPRDLCVRIQIRNAGPEAAELHVLPTLWFRNRWSWGDDIQRPSITVASSGRGEPAMAIAEDADLGRWRLVAGPDPTGRPPELAFLRERDKCGALVRGRRSNAIPEGWRQRSRRRRGRDSQSRAERDKDGLLASPLSAARRERRTSASPCTRRCGQRLRLGRRLRPDARQAPPGSGRILCDAAAARRLRRRSGRHAPGVRGTGLEPAILSLRPRALAGRRSE